MYILILTCRNGLIFNNKPKTIEATTTLIRSDKLNLRNLNIEFTRHPLQKGNPCPKSFLYDKGYRQNHLIFF